MPLFVDWHMLPFLFVPPVRYPRAFSMVVFRPYIKMSHQKYRKFKTLYLNLLEGCDIDERFARGKRYRRNRNLIIHEVNSAAACACRYMEILTKDLRGRSEDEVKAITGVLHQNAVVIKTGMKYAELYKCIRPYLGYPNIVIVVTDDDPDLVEVSHRFYHRTMNIKDKEDIRFFIETFYDLNILKALPGNQTIENTYSPYDRWFDPKLKRKLRAYSYIPSVKGKPAESTANQ